MPEFEPNSPEKKIWDVIVVGTGMGGATTGWALARKGYDVLFLEKGMFWTDSRERIHDESALKTAKDRLESGYWPHKMEGKTNWGKLNFHPPLGCGTGGSTALYAAQLERLLPLDFHPRSNYPDLQDSNLPEKWPIDYEELLPFYREAERLYCVSGTADPLYPDLDAKLRQPPKASERDEWYLKEFRKLKLNPYRAHYASLCDGNCDNCSTDPETMCQRNSTNCCLLPALKNYNAKILTECEVVRLNSQTNKIDELICAHRNNTIKLRSKVVVLAAGAYMTPNLLLNSKSEHWPNGVANNSGLVGKNLMMHASDFFIIRSKNPLSSKGPSKTISFNDFYVWKNTKLGTIQSIGIPINYGYILYFLRNKVDRRKNVLLKLARPTLPIIAILAFYYYRHSNVFVSILEDLPYTKNRIVPDQNSNNEIHFEYYYPEELAQRTRLFRNTLKKKFKSGYRMTIISDDNNLNFGHPCGTCRFGNDPKESVLNSRNQAHDIENLYITDASFFPSSGGTNPSLTIAANALRVSNFIDQDLEDNDVKSGSM